ncbi:DGQHR domain-containing protein [Rhizorhabdus histidinilytica]|uniref:DNA-sulfur modification-associated n=1 Tax=Rhizorhabdus histidinilytica TaxID=439228 RepID=A0A1T5A0V2_9SPHN|nr:DGQHR domain-containing protein [Rhizorhabdus histidinilytica]SKB28661.1 DNA-sulfur modification-associated [Rhizorhabdus histidinilytica]
MAGDEDVEENIHVAAQTVPALRFKQWLQDWDNYSSVSNGSWKKPEPYIYLFSMKAGDLRNLSDVYRRKYDGNISEGVQRAQDTNRTARIQRYVRYGYPYGDLAAPMRNKEHAHLKKPGWLPTAIVINILEKGTSRRGHTLNDDHLVQVTSNGASVEITVPEIDAKSSDYLAPFEVIDGQHRLWSFGNDDSGIPDDFELPVVAFKGLDVAWQAYLFWSINVSPKRINKSHAFDLYPLLRTQDWLEQFGELNVYREARAQELTELMYTHEKSVWHHRINMLGEKGVVGVSQNAWVKALTASFLSTGKGAGTKGLFQANLGEDDMPLPWSRGQQGAFLLKLWQEIASEIETGARHWWTRQYKGERNRPLIDRTSLLNQDMGLRATLSVANDIFVHAVDDWNLYDWRAPNIEDASFPVEASAAFESIDKAPFAEEITNLAKGIVAFDWRSLDGPGVKDSEEEVLKRSFRGSGGYTALKIEVLKSLATEQGTAVGGVAADLLAKMA